MAEDEQLFEKITGSEDSIQIGILEQTAHSGNELIAIAHHELIVSNLGDTAPRVLGSHAKRGPSPSSLIRRRMSCSPGKT